MRAKRVKWGRHTYERKSAGEAAARDPLIRPERYGFFDSSCRRCSCSGSRRSSPAIGAVFRDGDVSWHVAAGRWILEHGRVPDQPIPFSFTMPGSHG